MRDFLSSAKFPTLAFAPMWQPGRRWQNGPSVAPSSTTASLMMQYGLSATRSPNRLAVTWLPDPMTHSVPNVVTPSMTTWGSTTVSGPIVTVSSMYVLAGSTIVTPSVIGGRGCGGGGLAPAPRAEE